MKQNYKKQYTTEEKIAYYRKQIEFASRRIEQLERNLTKEWVKQLIEEKNTKRAKARKAA